MRILTQFLINISLEANIQGVYYCNRLKSPSVSFLLQKEFPLYQYALSDSMYIISPAGFGYMQTDSVKLASSIGVVALQSVE